MIGRTELRATLMERASSLMQGFEGGLLVLQVGWDFSCVFLVQYGVVRELVWAFPVLVSSLDRRLLFFLLLRGGVSPRRHYSVKVETFRRSLTFISTCVGHRPTAATYTRRCKQKLVDRALPLCCRQGEPGVGKTMLVEECGCEWQREGIQVRAILNNHDLRRP